ncbi:hypothetical protein NW752_004168 [Fusarium irregulare]|uniref:Uncharacterized protein n=1 Tax=Fusarium irregulare TaxID=2494466 RepID=A0A9W8U9L7_9HYPO|nr:hypothetical protein NW766_007067 [Fusarium irregulare]KAJ4021161.1 hypothetical protein NW752_004168 [Fusarium irregulare]
MPRLKADAGIQHIIDFEDHTGRPAKATWFGRKYQVLPPLPSLCFYFVHPDFNLEKINLGCFWQDHYREELEARGDVFEQVREVDRAKRDPEYAATRKAQGKLPGLVSSHRYPGAMAYHGLVIVYKDATWNREDEDKTFDVVQFGPALTSEDSESGDKIIVQEPLTTTRVRATSKEDSERFEDQGVWSWFMNHKPINWWV